MKGDNKKLKAQKTTFMVIMCMALFSVGIGVYSIVSDSQSIQKNKNNVVDLNDGKSLADNGDKKNSDNKVEQATKGDSFVDNSNIDNSQNNNENESEVDNIETENIENVNSNDALSFSKDSELEWPVHGEVILKYSMDSTIFFKTLNVYRCNPSISIAANVGDNVNSAAKGVVSDIYNSEETGTTMTVDIGNGYELTYGFLENVSAKKGDKIEKGQLLGTVAQPTAYYKEEGANVYFKMMQDDKPVDPTEFLKVE